MRCFRTGDTMDRCSASGREIPQYLERFMRILILLSILSQAPLALAAASCISLANSSLCSAFNASSISTGSKLVALYPFLEYVSDASSFDKYLDEYIASEYVKEKYQTLLGCSNVNLSNTTDYYARYTTSVICNGIIQNSKTPCTLSDDDARPLCADTCALQATSEEEIVVNDQLCSNRSSDYLTQIRADFTNCALPSDSLTGDCISGDENEPNNCGYSTNLVGLCDYCGSNSPNNTDTCCQASNATGRCVGVEVPTYTSIPPLFSTTATSSATATSTAQATNSGLSGAQIAGIVVGSVAGAAVLIGFFFLLTVCMRRRKANQQGTIFNQPTPPRRGPTIAPLDGSSGQGYEVLPGGRVARMSALEEKSLSSRDATSRIKRSYDDIGSKIYEESPPYRRGMEPPSTGKRTGSLSSTSLFAGADLSPGSGQQVSSPGVTSGQSERLTSFKDYYSNGDIHPNDKVSVLWAYQPRAPDEFELERGEMLKVVGIWDDGWATGVRVDERAEDYDGKRRVQRDSGVSNGSTRDSCPPTANGEIKAFPLVCVCLPEHWRKTLEEDVEEGSDTSSF